MVITFKIFKFTIVNGLIDVTIRSLGQCRNPRRILILILRERRGN